VQILGEKKAHVWQRHGLWFVGHKVDGRDCRWVGYSLREVQRKYLSKFPGVIVKDLAE
jgi:hypothetical protein